MGTIRIWDATTGHQLHKFETGKQNWTGGFSPDSQFFAATDGLGFVRIYALQPDKEDKEHWVHGDAEDRGRRWRRALAWHPNSRWLAVGCDARGEVLVLDVEKKELRQQRVLSDAATEVDSETRRIMMSAFTGVSQVKYVDNGNKLIVWTHGDGSIEVYDFAQQVKHRFARGGTEGGQDATAWRDKDGKATSGMGSGMIVGEDRNQGRQLLASLDADGVRIWSV